MDSVTYAWFPPGEKTVRCSQRLSSTTKRMLAECRGRSGTSGAAKRSRNALAAAAEASYRRGAGRAAHQAVAREGMRRLRARI